MQHSLNSTLRFSLRFSEAVRVENMLKTLEGKVGLSSVSLQ